MHLDIARIRADFPILNQQIHGKDLVYFDNAATTQKPLSVIQTIQNYYLKDNSNVHRGVHTLSGRATDQFELARKKLAKYMNAKSDKELVFTRGTTEAINLIAQSYGRHFLKAGDQILISQMEHHANIVPWQMLRDEIGIEIKVIPITPQGEIDQEAYLKLLNPKTKILAICHISNALGTINPIQSMIAAAKEVGAITVIDGAQASSHAKIDVQDFNCDFYAFSGHKMYGPTGIGVLYGKKELLEKMPPWHGGGNMIKYVSFDKTIYNDLPDKFEAGTPHIEGVIGFAAAIDYLNQFDLNQLAAYEQELLVYATEALQAQTDIQLIGTASHKTAILSFVMKGVHAHDIGTILDHQGIAVRTGHHCAMPVMQYYQVPSTTRASLCFYNTREEVDRLIQALEQVRKLFH